MGSVTRSLKETIDKMVADAIRRILPSVMNEVLVRTIAQSGAIAEGRPQKMRMKPGPKPKKKQKIVRETRQVAMQNGRSRKLDLSDLLDESAGADFYQDPRALMDSGPDPEETFDSHENDDDRPQVESRIRALPPELRALAEDVNMDGDEGEMWGDGEHDSAPLVAAGPEIRDIGRAAAVAGVDFNKIKNLMGKVSPQKRQIDPSDARAKAQFEAARIQRMRESLNNGKPIE